VKRSSIVIAALGAALVVSNTTRAFNTFDVGISRSYERASYDMESDALTRALAVIPVVAEERSSASSSTIWKPAYATSPQVARFIAPPCFPDREQASGTPDSTVSASPRCVVDG
jgi:hypothetical protein